MNAAPPGSDDDLDDLVRVRRGAHRARSNPVAALVPALLVVLAVLAVAIGTYALLSGTPGPAVVETVGPTAGPVDTPVPADTGGPTPEVSATTPAAATPAPAPTTTAPPPAPATTAPPPPVADRTVAVTVLNSTRTAGLAARAASALQDAGWRIAGTGNYRASSPPTTVYFGGPVEQVTAEAVAADLGGGRVARSDAFDEPLTVVLGADFSG